jgi:hypothetical protein
MIGILLNNKYKVKLLQVKVNPHFLALVQVHLQVNGLEKVKKGS